MIPYKQLSLGEMCIRDRDNMEQSDMQDLLDPTRLKK